MSVRMRIPGNIWLETWQTAKPVPARRQKRLFDDTKEAEKVLSVCCSFDDLLQNVCQISKKYFSIHLFVLFY